MKGVKAGFIKINLLLQLLSSSFSLILLLVSGSDWSIVISFISFTMANEGNRPIKSPVTSNTISRNRIDPNMTRACLRTFSS